MWQLPTRLATGSSLVLPGSALPPNSEYPMYGYVVCYQPDSHMPHRSSMDGAVSSILAGDGHADLSLLSLQQLRSVLEDGSLAVTELSGAQLTILARRCMIEEESETLLALVEQGAVSSLPEPVLQEMLVHGVRHQQVLLVRQVLASGLVEMNAQVSCTHMGIMMDAQP